jgi:hypothetical protein
MTENGQSTIKAGAVFVTMLYDTNDAAYRALVDIDLQAAAEQFRAESAEGEWLDRDAFKAMLVRKGIVERIECFEVSIPDRWDLISNLEVFVIDENS